VELSLDFLRNELSSIHSLVLLVFRISFHALSCILKKLNNLLSRQVFRIAINMFSTKTNTTLLHLLNLSHEHLEFLVSFFLELLLIYLLSSIVLVLLSLDLGLHIVEIIILNHFLTHSSLVWLRSLLGFLRALLALRQTYVHSS
jgi:hypothetical protein